MKKYVCVLMAAVTAMSLGGCKAYKYKPTEEVFNPGTYSATVAGHNDSITVEVTFDENRVTKIEVTEHGESLSIGDAAMQTVAEAIIKNQSFEVDTVSGATVSSVALLQAVASAAKMAGANDVPDITLTSLVGRPEAAKPEAAEDIDALGPPYEAGTYTASAKGFGGDVTVKITVDKDKITAVEASGAAETPTIGGTALDKLSKDVLAAGGLDVDIVTGATISCNAFINAAADALKKAKDGDTSETEPEETEPEETEPEETEPEETEPEETEPEETEPEETEPEETEPEETEPEETGDIGYTPGTYTGKAVGFGGDVTVTVEVDDEKIISVTAEGDLETAVIGGAALEKLVGEVEETGEPVTDVISNATISSEAFMEALQEALDKAKK